MLRPSLMFGCLREGDAPAEPLQLPAMLESAAQQELRPPFVASRTLLSHARNAGHTLPFLGTVASQDGLTMIPLERLTPEKHTADNSKTGDCNCEVERMV